MPEEEDATRGARHSLRCCSEKMAEEGQAFSQVALDHPGLCWTSERQGWWDRPWFCVP